MTRAQYEREKIFRLQREAEATRQRELQLLAQGRAAAEKWRRPIPFPPSSAAG